MKRLIAVAVLVGPLLMILGGLYMLFTPEVITEKIAYESSHVGGFMLVFMGGVLVLVGAMIADVVD